MPEGGTNVKGPGAARISGLSPSRSCGKAGAVPGWLLFAWIAAEERGAGGSAGGTGRSVVKWRYRGNAACAGERDAAREGGVRWEASPERQAGAVRG